MTDKTNDSRPFPLQGGSRIEWQYPIKKVGRSIVNYPRSTIPWWLAEIAYEVYSKKYGKSQSLDRLAERGGFGREEFLWLLSGGDENNWPQRYDAEQMR